MAQLSGIPKGRDEHRDAHAATDSEDDEDVVRQEQESQELKKKRDAFLRAQQDRVDRRRTIQEDDIARLGETQTQAGTQPEKDDADTLDLRPFHHFFATTFPDYALTERELLIKNFSEWADLTRRDQGWGQTAWYQFIKTLSNLIYQADEEALEDRATIELLQTTKLALEEEVTTLDDKVKQYKKGVRKQAEEIKKLTDSLAEAQLQIATLHTTNPPDRDRGRTTSLRPSSAIRRDGTTLDALDSTTL
ncbi:hypothetical protein BJ546DRAFT_1054987 [Cryomyces antarcticus]